MARFAAGAVFGLVVGIVGAAALGLHASSDQDELLALAAEAGVDVQDLRAAAAVTGVSPRDYLVSTGELEPPSPPRPTPFDRRVECVIQRESNNNPRAVNPRSGASGLGQFLASTWRSTPQGQAGASVFDPIANRAAVAWMLATGRGREFVAISAGLC
jgi:hypothetical protein